MENGTQIQQWRNTNRFMRQQNHLHGHIHPFKILGGRPNGSKDRKRRVVHWDYFIDCGQSLCILTISIIEDYLHKYCVIVLLLCSLERREAAGLSNGTHIAVGQNVLFQNHTAPSSQFSQMANLRNGCLLQHCMCHQHLKLELSSA